MKLGTRLIISLVVTILVTMTVHGYLSIQQDQENVTREIRVGMRGFSRAIHSALRDLYADGQNLQATQEFADTVGPRGNIHGLIVYNLNGEPVALSSSLRYPNDFAELDPTAILKLDPRPALGEPHGVDGYIREPGILVYYRIEPFTSSDGRIVGVFVLARQGSQLISNIETRRQRIIGTTAALVILLSVLILIIVRRNVTRPINQLVQRVREIGRGRWEQRIEIRGRDEIAALAGEFNSMSEELNRSYSKFLEEQQQKLKLERDLRHSERLASVGQLAAGLAHEIGTPLSIVRGRAEYLLRRPRSSEELAGNLEVIRSQSDRITAIVRQLLEFSRRREPMFRSVDLSGLINHVGYLLEHQLLEKNLKVEIHVSPKPLLIQADPDLLQQVFINLFANSLHALDRDGTIKIRAYSASSVDGQGSVRIVFEDNGVGIAPEVIDHVFDPFFTTKDVGEGAGLGLAVTYGIIKEHGGEITLESEPGKFSRFVIHLPQGQRKKTSLQGDLENGTQL
ncbi:MAG TPA: ATP-binding protein [Candidatus Binatia bacterium]|nr:ATP-binding protein [Candidatus Binatia bacterium]